VTLWPAEDFLQLYANFALPSYRLFFAVL